MLVTVHVTRTEAGYSATAPDLPDCKASGSTLGPTLARVHLAIEVSAGQILSDTGSLPVARSLADLVNTGEFPHDSLYEIYVEDRQLAAMAAHQAK